MMVRTQEILKAQPSGPAYLIYSQTRIERHLGQHMLPDAILAFHLNKLLECGVHVHDFAASRAEINANHPLADAHYKST